MIYVSSSCVKSDRISTAIEQLVSAGFKNIELSGGTETYADLENDLLSLQEKYQLNYLCHNYFPPPEKPFILNLAALDEETAQLSFEHCKRAIDLSVKLGAELFAFHAGFLINIPLNEIGKKISRKDLFDKEEALKNFHEKLISLMDHAAGRVNLYIENNVLSLENFQEFDHDNPFFFTHAENLAEARGESGINYLLDLAHLKVSCKSLGLDLEDQMEKLIEGTDYLHLSDNDGMRDQNQGLQKNSDLFQSLQKFNLKGKNITLETYTDLGEIRRSYDLIESIL